MQDLEPRTDSLNIRTDSGDNNILRAYVNFNIKIYVIFIACARCIRGNKNISIAEIQAGISYLQPIHLNCTYV